MGERMLQLRDCFDTEICKSTLVREGLLLYMDE
jgi:hypothetical protein